MNENNMKGISLRSPEEIRQELIAQWNWDIHKMAQNYRRTVNEMANLLQYGGDEWRKKKYQAKNTKLVKATYDVTFAPVANVETEVADPHNPTDSEMCEIIELAVNKIINNMDEEISGENVRSVSLMSTNNTDVPNPKPLKPEGTDLEILVELTALVYDRLYAICDDGVAVNTTIRQHAMHLTQKYWNTDWDERDFWLTMEEEAEKFIQEEKEKRSAF